MRRFTGQMILLALLLAGCRSDHIAPTTSNLPVPVTQKSSGASLALRPPFRGNLSEVVNQKIDLDGLWHPAGKFGPYIIVGTTPVYFVASGTNALGQRNSLGQTTYMENSYVRLSGVLRKQNATAATDSNISGIPEYYYMEYPGIEVYLVLP